MNGFKRGTRGFQIDGTKRERIELELVIYRASKTKSFQKYYSNFFLKIITLWKKGENYYGFKFI